MDQAQQIIRIFVQLASGYLIGKGYMSEDSSLEIIGGVTSGLTVAWWAFWDWKRILK